MKATAYLIHYTRREKQNGKYPVKVRVVYQRQPKDFPTGIDLSPEEYSKCFQKRASKELSEIGFRLNSAKSKADNIISDLPVFTFKKFEDAFYERVKEAGDLYSLFDEYIKALMSDNRVKTASSYNSAKRSFQKFKSKVGLYDITHRFLKEYHQFQIEKKVSETTIGIYVRSLRSIFNYAIALGIIKKDESYPFGRRMYVIPAGRNIKKALSLDQVRMISNYQTIQGSSEDRARDLWLLSYLCNGINFKDIAQLQNKNIDGDMLRFVRAKTKHSTRGNQSFISCHLSDRAKSIIAKWRNKNSKPDAFLFPFLESTDSPTEQVKKVAQLIQTTNKYMKRISDKLGFERIATTYYSRHSAATILKRSGASISQIQEALGHQNSSTTQKYLDSFDDDSKKELSNSLSNFL